MLDVLDRVTGADKERKRKFYDLAAAGRNEIPADIAKLITGHPLELDKIRDTLTTLLTAQG